MSVTSVHPKNINTSVSSQVFHSLISLLHVIVVTDSLIWGSKGRRQYEAENPCPSFACFYGTMLSYRQPHLRDYSLV